MCSCYNSELIGFSSIFKIAITIFYFSFHTIENNFFFFCSSSTLTFFPFPSPLSNFLFFTFPTNQVFPQKDFSASPVNHFLLRGSSSCSPSFTLLFLSSFFFLSLSVAWADFQLPEADQCPFLRPANCLVFAFPVHVFSLSVSVSLSLSRGVSFCLSLVIYF